MADDEQFSLCWNNFNSNLSAGFHESLCREDLVDVTLAAEGQLVKAHRLVLSVCSPYFRRMFTQMPANQHAFVFLKDVSHSALKDLIQFMYCGEVNVKQDALPAFISTAEALQIKGLTDSEPAPSQSPAKPSTPAPQTIAATLTTTGTTTSPRTRTSNQRTRYKIESEDSGDENKPTNQLVLQATQTQQQPTLVQQQTQKRPAQRSITPHTAPTVKRIKSNVVDPLEGSDATTTQITVQAVTDSKTITGEPEYIDLPIDLPTKSEPDYAEETADVEAAEQEPTYVEDDSYGDMKYDESYFTENEEAAGTGATATTSGGTVKQSGSFSESYVSDTGDQQASEAQGKTIFSCTVPTMMTTQKKSTPSKMVTFVTDINGQKIVVYDGHHFRQASERTGALLFRCVRFKTTQCPANILVTKRTKTIGLPHNHEDLAISDITSNEFNIDIGDIGNVQELLQKPLAMVQQQQQQQMVDTTNESNSIYQQIQNNTQQQTHQLNVFDKQKPQQQRRSLLITNESNSNVTFMSHTLNLQNFQSKFKEHFGIRD